MLFEWDPGKSELNLKKHKVSFTLAATIFDDLLHLSIPDHTSRDEARWVTIGLAADQATLVVVHTHRSTKTGNEVIRIISARKATAKERRQYEEGI